MRALGCLALLSACSVIDAATGEDTSASGASTIERIMISGAERVAVTAEGRIAVLGGNQLRVVDRVGPDSYNIGPTIPISGGARDLIAVDLDASGPQEFAIAFDDSSVLVVSADGSRTTTCQVAGGDHELATGDYDDDGRGDLVVAAKTGGPPQVTFFWGVATSPTGLDCATKTDVTPPVPLMSVATIRYNTGISLAVGFDRALAVYVKDMFRQLLRVDNPMARNGQHRHLAVGQFNDDAIDDLAVHVTSGGPAFTTVGFASGSEYALDASPSLAMGEQATDLVVFRTTTGRHAIALARVPGGPEGVVLLTRRDGGGFDRVDVEDGYDGQPQSLAAADLDGDGADEVIGAIMPTGDVRVLMSSSR